MLISNREHSEQFESGPKQLTGNFGNPKQKSIELFQSAANSDVISKNTGPKSRRENGISQARRGSAGIAIIFPPIFAPLTTPRIFPGVVWTTGTRSEANSR